MKVAKKVRLLSKDAKGNYVKNENYDVIRHRAVIQESEVKTFQDHYKTTGLLYIVDDKATKEFKDSKKPKKNS